ncbi:MAG TPA: SURF1 family protein [Burkholderiaceae bacterium]|nr:SURF1 family protein [Burkholderiaceae bacterium]
MIDYGNAMLAESRKRFLVVTLAAAFMAVLTAGLGRWQLDRARQKTELRHSMDVRAAMPPVVPSQLARSESDAKEQWHRSVRLKGRWLADRTIYLDNRQHDGLPGFFVLTLLELAPGDAVVVQRGWLPRDARDRTRIPPYDTPTGIVEVTGRIAPPPSRLYDLPGAASGPIRQNLDLGAYAHEVGIALRPLSVWQEGASGDGLLRDWPRPQLNVQMHYGYAFQWFALCALVTGLYVWFQLLRPRRPPIG